MAKQQYGSSISGIDSSNSGIDSTAGGNGQAGGRAGVWRGGTSAAAHTCSRAFVGCTLHRPEGQAERQDAAQEGRGVSDVAGGGAQCFRRIRAARCALARPSAAAAQPRLSLVARSRSRSSSLKGGPCGAQRMICVRPCA
ncbi:hypothetical protein PLESTB_000710900 [Pleodorina starrii]|uniref:Uncharacterized protein n=1 Tax=Pleodorina starrii TaxID=330485 RepID=A0A9W6BJ22_9CHLO|nr:hypothetical protein PLESTM_000782200 [Pleodorina starrii]GLC48063.1 hypothetical protein PLESTB_000055100 [Pleodorina starrii]GLC53126.1 hypothetical protein PLESTB_000710900 [Pleodorina starrii]GLC68066.1 hypothetical protein PLESTF_000642400 [Pleodorina starrii]